jgi:hypothetical protein
LDSSLLKSIASCCLSKYYLSVSSNLHALDCAGTLDVITMFYSLRLHLL